MLRDKDVFAISTCIGVFGGFCASGYFIIRDTEPWATWSFLFGGASFIALVCGSLIREVMVSSSNAYSADDLEYGVE